MHSSLQWCSRNIQVCCIVAILGSVLVSFSHAQQPLQPEYPYQPAVVASIGTTLHVPSFSAIEGIPGANVPFTSQFGVSAMVGGGITKRLGTLFSAGVLVQGSLLSGSVVSDESTVLSINDFPVPATIRHAINLSLYALAIEPSIRLHLEPLRIRIGVPIQLLLNGSFVATQQVTNPPGVYIDGETIRKEDEGALPGLQTLLPALSLSFGTIGKVVGTVRIEPEVTFGIPVASITSAADWKLWTLSAGVRIAPAFDKIRPIQRDTLWIRDTSVVEIAATNVGTTSSKIYVEDSVDAVDEDVIVRHVSVREITTITVPRELPFLRAEARAMFVDQQGQERDRISIRTVKYDNEFLMPLISIIYFAPRSSDLTSYDARDVSLPNAWERTSYSRLISRLQFKLLDDWAQEIIRSKLLVTLRGRVSNSEDPSLADQRVAAVFEHFMNRGVPRSRIRVLAPEILDDSASNARTVFIDPGTTRPMMQREMWSTVQPEECNIRIHLRAGGDAPVRSWEVTFSNRTSTIEKLRGVGELPEHLLFKVPDSVVVAMESGSDFTYRVHVQSDDSISFTSEPARISMQRASDDGVVRTKRFMVVPTKDLAAAHHAALHTLQWKNPILQELSQEEIEKLHEYGATWGRLINGMVLVLAD